MNTAPYGAGAIAAGLGGASPAGAGALIDNWPPPTPDHLPSRAECIRQLKNYASQVGVVATLADAEHILELLLNIDHYFLERSFL